MANYLYNGIELPALPNIDLPYAVIGYGAVGVYNLYCSSTPFAAYVRNEATGAMGISNSGTEMVHYQCDTVRGSGKWTEQQPITANLAGADWTNTDILNPDGSLYLAASDPIPVYDPTALLQGYLVGCRIRAQRNRGGAT